MRQVRTWREPFRGLVVARVSFGPLVVAHPLPGLGEDRLGLDVEPPGIGVGVG